jgi:hypothetical protein
MPGFPGFPDDEGLLPPFPFIASAAPVPTPAAATRIHTSLLRFFFAVVGAGSGVWLET